MFGQVTTNNAFYPRASILFAGTGYYLSWTHIKWNKTMTEFKAELKEDFVPNSDIVRIRFFKN